MIHERFAETGEGLRIFRPGRGEVTAELRHMAAVNDLLAFWGRLGDAHVHPDDAQMVKAPDFATDLMPVPWAGSLRSAKVYFLFLNPGLSEDDRAEEARPAFKEARRHCT